MARTSSVCFSNPFAFAKETYVNPGNKFNDEESADNIEDFVEYIVCTHGIEVPEDFSKQLKMAHFEFRMTPFYMPFKTADSIISTCKMWEPYIAEEDFDKLVCGELISMPRIHASVLAARNFEKQQNLRLTNEPNYFFVTIVDYSGSIKVYQ